MKYIKVQVQEITQGSGVKLLLGKMKAIDLITITDVDRWAEKHLDAYQRQEYPERCHEIARYIEMQSPLTVFPSSVVISLREGSELIAGANGWQIIRIPRTQAAAWIADGQHRIGGFRALAKSQASQIQIEGPAPELVAKALEMELPVTFVYLVGQGEEKAKGIERAIFWLMNKTAKPIRPSLTDYLQWEIATKGMFRHPILERQEPRIQATPLALGLHRDADSPLYGLVNPSGARGLGRPIQLNSLVTGLERKLIKNQYFTQLPQKMQITFLKNFWQVIKEVHPPAFAKATRRDYYILKALPVYALLELADDVFEKCRDGKDQLDPKDIAIDKLRPILKPLSTFNFAKKDKSPLAAFGGHAGVRAAYNLLNTNLVEAGTLPQS